METVRIIFGLQSSSNQEYNSTVHPNRLDFFDFLGHEILIIHLILEFSADGVSVPEEEREGYAWLQERDKLEDFAVDGAAYNGPKIVEC